MTQKLIKRKNKRKSRHTSPRSLSELVNKVKLMEKKKEFPSFKAGDTISVSLKIKEGEKQRLQTFEGIVISEKNKLKHSSFTVRKISHDVGVERIFTESSPTIENIKLIQKGRVRRSKIYYLRKLSGKAARIEKDFKNK